MKYIVSFFCLLSLMQTVIAQEDKQYETSLTTKETEILFDLPMDPAERQLMQSSLEEQLNAYQSLHSFQLANSVPPAYTFSPGMYANSKEYRSPAEDVPNKYPIDETIKLPENPEELAFYSVANLGYLIRSQQITALELTKFFLDRLKKWGDTLECIVTITEELALKQAKIADEEIARGEYKGPLHGIPYGAKDLLAVPDYPTTWGAAPYKHQVLDEKATVIQKLEDAGAILVAKLTLGALAWGDVWFGGQTKNPWNLAQGSSGSSAGSASATAAGLVPFAIGSETLGSIISPSLRCGVTGLRPTFGRVSRHGAMVLSWSMDKLGPICRNAVDCAIVLDAIKGEDGKDASVSNHPFQFDANITLENIRVGYVGEVESIDTFKHMGVALEPIELPVDLPISAMRIILSAEAAAAFDELTRSGKDTLLVRQIANAWPNVFRAARFIPAVEYIQAQRYRYLLMQQMDEIFNKVDVIISPTYANNQLLITNLTGHPAILIPNGLDEEGNHKSFTIIGDLYDEAKILALAHLYQARTPFDEEHPPKFQP